MKKSSLFAGGLAAALGLTLAPGSAGATAPPADENAFCGPWRDVTALFSGPDEVDPAAAEQALAEVSATAPDELAESVEVVVAAATQAASGDFSAFDTPEFGSSLSQVDNWIFDNCGFDQVIEVQAVDWAFGDIPLEIPAGSTAFRLTNLGDEIHELTIIRKIEGTTESFEELAPLIAAEDPSVMEKVEFVAGAFSPGPDMPGVAYADLVPGEYAAICFIPIGSLQEGASEGTGTEGTGTEGTDTEGTAADGAAPAPTTDSTGPADTTGGSAPEGDGAGYDPHFAHGMLQLFTVVEGA